MGIVIYLFSLNNLAPTVCKIVFSMYKSIRVWYISHGSICTVKYIKSNVVFIIF